MVNYPKKKPIDFQKKKHILPSIHSLPHKKTLTGDTDYGYKILFYFIYFILSITKLC